MHLKHKERGVRTSLPAQLAWPLKNTAPAPAPAVGDADLGDESDEDDGNPENAGKTAMFEDFFGPRTGGELPYFRSASAAAAAVNECRVSRWRPAACLGVPPLLSKCAASGCLDPASTA